ncbi:MAG TPA: hypothetical protein VMH84_10710 [Xanthobacteraceae bacterium]|nr:hypothetical protein [Xanthobacteraceae bacterium]
MAAKVFIVDCPGCRAKVAAEEVGRVEDTGWADEAMEPYGERLLIGKCPNPKCKSLIAARSYQTSFEGFEGDDENIWSDPVRVYPDPPKGFSSHNIPKAATNSIEQANNCLQANAYDAASVMYGRALEAVCRELLLTKDQIKAGKGIVLASGLSNFMRRGSLTLASSIGASSCAYSETLVLMPAINPFYGRMPKTYGFLFTRSLNTSTT